MTRKLSLRGPIDMHLPEAKMKVPGQRYGDPVSDRRFDEVMRERRRLTEAVRAGIDPAEMQYDLDDVLPTPTPTPTSDGDST